MTEKVRYGDHKKLEKSDPILHHHFPAFVIKNLFDLHRFLDKNNCSVAPENLFMNSNTESHARSIFIFLSHFHNIFKSINLQVSHSSSARKHWVDLGAGNYPIDDYKEHFGADSYIGVDLQNGSTTLPNNVYHCNSDMVDFAKKTRDNAVALYTLFGIEPNLFTSTLPEVQGYINELATELYRTLAPNGAVFAGSIAYETHTDTINMYKYAFLKAGFQRKQLHEFVSARDRHVISNFELNSTLFLWVKPTKNSEISFI